MVDKSVLNSDRIISMGQLELRKTSSCRNGAIIVLIRNVVLPSGGYSGSGRCIYHTTKAYVNNALVLKNIYYTKNKL